jgi:hypothetical protein
LNSLYYYHVDTIKQLFGVDAVQVRLHVNEGDRPHSGLGQEHNQRKEITKGWNEFGMAVDHKFLPTRMNYLHNFLHAIQSCVGIRKLEYKQHYCDHP